MKTFAVAAVLVAAAGASANIMEMDTQQFGFQLSPGSQVVNFAGFNTQGGIRVLKAVQLDVDGTIQANVTAENDSNIEVSNFGVGLTGIVDVDGPGAFDAGLGIVQSAGPVSVGATDGVPGSGPDFNDFGLISGSDSDSALAIFGLGVFTNPFSFNVNGSGGFSTSGTSDSTLRLSDFGASGTIKVTYFYDIVPTPGTAAVAGLVALAGLRRRR